MTVVKSKEIVFRVPVCFSKKKTTTKKKKKKKERKEHFSKYINIKIEMNLCSGKTAKLKNLFLIERDFGFNAQLYKSEFSYLF